MKKIVALGAAAALVGGLFAAEPASNPSLVSFTGNASVEWGVDLDAGKTGFKNGTWTEFKIKLFDAGDKSTSGDGVWAELVMKVDDGDSCGPNGFQDGKWKDPKNAYIDVAKLHFNNVYVGIKSGDCKVGQLDFTTAVRSADPWFHPGRWLKDVGPTEVVGQKATEDGATPKTEDAVKEYSQGIVAGYEDDNLNVGVDFRSLDWGQYTNAYAFAVEGKLKDSNSFAEGLSVGLGAAYNLTDTFYDAGSKAFDANSKKDDIDENPAGTEAEKVIKHETYSHNFAYSASLGYKLSINDTYWLKPQVGLVGAVSTYNRDFETASTYDFGEYSIPNVKSVKASSNSNVAVAGLMFGWGETNSYGSTGGLYYFDDDSGDKAKGLTPGLSVVAYIPFTTTSKADITLDGANVSGKIKAHDALQALIVPSLYSGELVENLKFAAYSEMGLFNGKKDPVTNISATELDAEGWESAIDPDNTFALALAAGLKYDIKADDITITPKASVRYANATYMDNKAAIDAVVPASDKGMFKDSMGKQKTKNKDGILKPGTTTGELADLYDGDFFNLEAGVDVAGLINNTTFSVHYKSANLLNDIDYSEPKDADGNAYKYYNIKLGTLNVGCKIAF